MSPEDKSYDRLVATSAESASLMGRLVKELDELVASDGLADLIGVREQLAAFRDQLDVAAIALYTEIDEVADGVGEPDVSVSNGTHDRPDLRVLNGGIDTKPYPEPTTEDALEGAAVQPLGLVGDISGGTVRAHNEVRGFGASLPPIPEPKVRRPIAIPANIQDDPEAVARHVVASPNIVLLIDGDEVATLGWSAFPLSEQRAALITYLAELSESAGCKPDVVLDGRVGAEGTTHASKAVRLRLTKAPTAPVEALAELIDAYPVKWPLAVVTDDGELAMAAIERNIVVLKNKQLLNLFNPA